VKEDSEEREVGEADRSRDIAEDKASELNLKTQCVRNFGYLSERSKGEEIPDECMTCGEMLDCMVKPSKKESSDQQ
jgi:hypothetical protein